MNNKRLQDVCINIIVLGITGTIILCMSYPIEGTTTFKPQTNLLNPCFSINKFREINSAEGAATERINSKDGVSESAISIDTIDKSGSIVGTNDVLFRGNDEWFNSLYRYTNISNSLTDEGIIELI